MTAPHLRQFSRRGESLVYWSERSGGRQAFQIDLKNGDSRQLTDVVSVDSGALSLSADERNLLFFDGLTLNETALGTLKTRELYRTPEGSSRAGFAVAGDGSIFFTERRGTTTRILRFTRQHTAAILETNLDIEFLMARPHHAQLLYGRGGELWLVGNDGTGKRQLRPQPGQTGEVLWSPSGRTLLYLHTPDDPKQLITLREFSPDDNSDRQVSRTSQFAAFSPNADTSVFAGASRSKASAYVLILLRVTRRELTLCEHRASDPAMVSPRFSPDSQSVFFVSDRHGKPALYRVHVEKFVEQTGDGAS
jgi:oligogalacturonide lyase